MASDPKEKLGGAPHSKQSLRLWLRLLSCAMTIERRVQTKLAERFNTTLPRFDVLAALDRSPDGLRMSELSDFLLVSKGNVTGLVDRLISDGLVERLAAGTDRRVVRVRLTSQGKSQFAAMAAEHEQWLDHLMSDLSHPDFEQVLEGLRRLRMSIEENPL